MQLHEDMLVGDHRNASRKPHSRSQLERRMMRLNTQAGAEQNESRRSYQSHQRRHGDLRTFSAGAFLPDFGIGHVFVMKQHAKEHPVSQRTYDGGNNNSQADVSQI